jgi:hypothetical protein
MAGICSPPKASPNAVSRASVMPMRNDLVPSIESSMRARICCAIWSCGHPRICPAGGNLRTLGELLKAGRFGNRLRRLSTENLSTLFDLFTKSAGDYLDAWFEGELLKAWLGFDAIVGNYASPYTRAPLTSCCITPSER